ncbi:MAG TPA: glutaredoxin domain-containing protein [Vicinamibacteria bacterium]|nr:glutaredoxin domain-containing protein [Vicinamibacteria bacterium]
MAAPWPVAAQTPAPAPPDVLEVFVREGCPHCAAAKEFLPGFASGRPGLRIVYRPVDVDASARDDLIRHSRAAGIWPPGVPMFRFAGRILVGFDDATSSGPHLAALVGPGAAEGGPVETSALGTLSVARLGLPLFTLVLGLLDGFNPCAMWVLLFLLSMLVHLRDRLRMALIAGTFVAVSGAVYYAFMAAWLNVFLIVGLSRTLRVALGGLALVIGAVNVKDFFAPEAGPSLSIPDAAKPGLYARMRAILQANTLKASLPAVALLAVIVNFVELLCTAGLPALYTAVLTQQGLSPAAHYAYLGLYIAGYIADDTLMVATAVLALSSRKLTERAGRRLKLLSGVIMLALGVVMILRPEWLR